MACATLSGASLVRVSPTSLAPEVVVNAKWSAAHSISDAGPYDPAEARSLGLLTEGSFAVTWDQEIASDTTNDGWFPEMSREPFASGNWTPPSELSHTAISAPLDTTEVALTSNGSGAVEYGIVNVVVSAGRYGSERHRRRGATGTEAHQVSGLRGESGGRRERRRHVRADTGNLRPPSAVGFDDQH